ncbi:MAG: phosphotransferase [Planctomycetes bacterium]|nr:phosphotransferase [Planctomycetota bacterium]
MSDAAELDRWWQTFVATGRLPAELPLVQGRLVRAVHRGRLPSGDVFVKVMTFPRGKDRLRYLLRPLPGAHEATMLGATGAAGIPCPEVVAVRTARRFGLPHRSMLVLRALPVRTAPEPAAARLADEAALATRLLAAGIVHRDLHPGNFVRLVDGRLAVLDLQSAGRAPRGSSAASRFAIAVRLLQDRGDLPPAEAQRALTAGGLLADAATVDRVLAAAARARAEFLRRRIRRCFEVGTEFTRHVRWCGIEHRTRGELAGGRWWRGNRTLRRAWLGQRAQHLLEGTPPRFAAFLQKWWWLGGGGALYAPRACSEERFQVDVREALSAYERHVHRIERSR